MKSRLVVCKQRRGGGVTNKNAGDIIRAQDGHIAEKDVRTVTLTAIVDTGATRIECKITEPVRIQWKDRFASVDAVVLPEGKPLLGVIPLEFMDLMVDPIRQELVGAHGDSAVLMAM